MNESETRTEYIDPKLKFSGWGEVEESKIYTEPDFNKIITIKEREAKRVKILLSEINQNEKTI